VQVFFPLQPVERTSAAGQETPDIYTFQKMISCNNARQMFEALTLENREKTPLHLAIENDHLW